MLVSSVPASGFDFIPSIGFDKLDDRWDFHPIADLLWRPRTLNYGLSSKYRCRGIPLRRCSLLCQKRNGLRPTGRVPFHENNCRREDSNLHTLYGSQVLNLAPFLSGRTSTMLGSH